MYYHTNPLGRYISWCITISIFQEDTFNISCHLITIQVRSNKWSFSKEGPYFWTTILFSITVATVHKAYIMPTSLKVWTGKSAFWNGCILKGFRFLYYSYGNVIYRKTWKFGGLSGWDIAVGVIWPPAICMPKHLPKYLTVRHWGNWRALQFHVFAPQVWEGLLGFLLWAPSA